MLFSLIRGQMSFEAVVVSLLVMAMMIFLILPVHEFSHAGVAYLLGDRDIRRRGRLTLNPLAHLDIFGALCLLLFSFGWAKPVPVNDRNFKYPKLYMAITALAGPVSNILCGCIGGLATVLICHFAPEFAMGKFGQYVMMFLYYFIVINITLAVFNLIPIPPLDGSKVLFVFLPDRAVEFCYRMQRYSFLLIYALMFSGVLNGVMDACRGFLLKVCLFFDPLSMLVFGA